MGSSDYILVVEDDCDIREALLQILQEEGYTVRGAADGREALDWAMLDPPPKLILLDLTMPVMNGWEFRAEQLSTPRIAAIPVIVISADPHLTTMGSSLGSVDLLKKPIPLDALLSIVRSRTST